ncbi:MAG: divergent polysaccharide deacetylase family protein [Alphaproteobacteria bacterium]|nr:divergent polysaccharide deacetylase family protein [Alphaproteobacteria bacterium]
MLPVLSRLSLAWLSALGVAAVIIAGLTYSITSGKGPGRVSLSIDGMERIARHEPSMAARQTPAANQTATETPGLRLAPPSLRDANEAAMETIEGAEGEDFLLYPEEPDFADSGENGGEIIITIAGGGPKAIPATAASLTRRTHATKIAEIDPALLRATPFGKAPRIAPDGRKAMHVYAAASPEQDGAPQIAIIVGGLGLNSALTQRAIDELPAEISLAFAPYAKDLKFWTQKARDAGHEILIELPMEGYGANVDALGPAGLLTTQNREENLQRLDWLMSRFGGYFAATNYLGAKFSTQDEAMRPILKKLTEAGVAYIDDTGASTIAGVRRDGGAIASVDRIVPPAPDPSRRNAVRRELRALELIAKRDGAALGKTYAYATTLDEITAWAEGLEEDGFVAAPASTVLQRQASRR